MRPLAKFGLGLALALTLSGCVVAPPYYDDYEPELTIVAPPPRYYVAPPPRYYVAPPPRYYVAPPPPRRHHHDRRPHHW